MCNLQDIVHTIKRLDGAPCYGRCLDYGNSKLL